MQHRLTFLVGQSMQRITYRHLQHDQHKRRSDLTTGVAEPEYRLKIKVVQGDETKSSSCSSRSDQHWKGMAFVRPPTRGPAMLGRLGTLDRMLERVKGPSILQTLQKLQKLQMLQMLQVRQMLLISC